MSKITSEIESQQNKKKIEEFKEAPVIANNVNVNNSNNNTFESKR